MLSTLLQDRFKLFPRLAVALTRTEKESQQNNTHLPQRRTASATLCCPPSNPLESNHVQVRPHPRRHCLRLSLRAGTQVRYAYGRPAAVVRPFLMGFGGLLFGPLI